MPREDKKGGDLKVFNRATSQCCTSIYSYDQISEIDEGNRGSIKRPLYLNIAIRSYCRGIEEGNAQQRVAGDGVYGG